MFCNKCGQEIPEASVFCYKCGNSTEKNQVIKPIFTPYESEIHITNISKEVKENDQRRGGGVFAVLLIIGLLIVVLKIFQSNNNAHDVTADNTDTLNAASNASEKETVENNYQYEQSIGAYTFDSGQVIEYFSNSIAFFCYGLNQMTDYQKEEISNEVNGQYMYIFGEVTGVSDTGVITILCIDKKASEQYELLWPMEAFADLTLITEQQSILNTVQVGEKIVALGQFNTGSDSSMLGIDTLTLANGIIIDHFLLNE